MQNHCRLQLNPTNTTLLGAYRSVELLLQHIGQMLIPERICSKCLMKTKFVGEPGCKASSCKSLVKAVPDRQHVRHSCNQTVIQRSVCGSMRLFVATQKAKKGAGTGLIRIKDNDKPDAVGCGPQTGALLKLKLRLCLLLATRPHGGLKLQARLIQVQHKHTLLKSLFCDKKNHQTCSKKTLNYRPNFWIRKTAPKPAPSEWNFQLRGTFSRATQRRHFWGPYLALRALFLVASMACLTEAGCNFLQGSRQGRWIP